MQNDCCSPAICHFPRPCSPMPLYKAIMQSQAAQGQSTANIELRSCSFPDKLQTFTAPPQPGYPLRPFHTPGVSGFKASSWGLKSHLCSPPIPPGNFARSEWLMFQETPKEVNSRFLSIHYKGAKESAKLVGSLQPSQWCKEATLCCTSISIHWLISWQPWTLEQLGKWKTKGIVHDVYLYPQCHVLIPPHSTHLLFEL